MVRLLALGVILLASCSSSPTSNSTCGAAGGTCLPAKGNPCQKVAPGSAQDCNPSLLPDGPFCCLDTLDAGAQD